MRVPRFLLLIPTIVVFVGSDARGQDVEPLTLKGGGPSGLRSSITDAWGVLGVEVQNAGTTPRDARVLVFYPGRPDEQYGLDLWVPGRTVRSSWAAIGPAAPDRMTTGRELQSLLYDRTGGSERLVLPPGTERTRSRLALYRKREFTTAVLFDDPAIASPAHETVQFVHAMRQLAGLPEHLQIPLEKFLPPMAEAFDSLDMIVVAGNTLSADPLGGIALREWIQQRGRLWILLDRVNEATVGPLLGDDFDLQVVDRVSLTSVRLHRPADPVPAASRLFDEPVDLVRVSPGSEDQILHLVNGWPASFSRRVGRGRVIITTLGARAWTRPRTATDVKSPYVTVIDLPVALPPLDALAREFNLRLEAESRSVDLGAVATEEIGYAVVDRRVAGGILGAFVLALAGAGLSLRRSLRPERIGWIGPLAALVAAGAFILLGVSSRRAVPATVAVAALADIVPGSGEAAAEGQVAVYRPESGPVPLHTERGGILDLDSIGLEGQTRRRMMTDRGQWHWEGLSLPAGLRAGHFRQTLQTGPVTASVRFGAEGVVGQVVVPRFGNLSDGLMASVKQDVTPLVLESGGRFVLGEPLPPGRFLSETVLSDRQQRHQAVYRSFLGSTWPQHLQGRDVLLAWAEPEDRLFEVEAETRTTGSMLLVIPVSFERSAPATRVRVPAAFVPYRRLTDGRLIQPTLDSVFPVEQELRFQLPASVLPLEVDRAVLTLRVRAPERQVVVAGVAEGRAESLHEVESPIDAVRVEIADGRFLRLDERGGLILTVMVRGASESAWVIEDVGLEVFGQTRARSEAR